MIRSLSLLLCLLAPGVVLAQSAAGATGPQSADLNLAVPQAPMQYLGDGSLRGDPPGTFYGDKSGRKLSDPGAGNGIATVTDDKLRVNGSVTTGIGYSKEGGNSHYNGAELNLNKNYTTDEGKTHNMNLNIRVSEGKGPGFYGPYGGYGGYGYGPGPGYWDYPAGW